MLTTGENRRRGGECLSECLLAPRHRKGGNSSTSTGDEHAHLARHRRTRPSKVARQRTGPRSGSTRRVHRLPLRTCQADALLEYLADYWSARIRRDGWGAVGASFATAKYEQAIAKNRHPTPFFIRQPSQLRRGLADGLTGDCPVNRGKRHPCASGPLVQRIRSCHTPSCGASGERDCSAIPRELRLRRLCRLVIYGASEPTAPSDRRRAKQLDSERGSRIWRETRPGTQVGQNGAGPHMSRLHSQEAIDNPANVLRVAHPT